MTNFLKRSLAVVVAVAFVSTVSFSANAAQPVVSPASVSTFSSASELNDVDDLTQDLANLGDGQTYVYKSPDGHEFNITKNGKNFQVAEKSTIAKPAASMCANTWAAIISGIGAVGLAALAAAATMASGGTILIAGASFSASQLGALAALAGSYSALQTYFDSKFC